MSFKRKMSRPGNAMSPRFQTEAERDSGFSDASSEHFGAMDTTDSEDLPGPVQPGSRAPGPKGTLSKPGAQLAVVGGSYSSLSPMIIMNNMVLKQPGDSPPAMKPWRFSPAVEVVQPMVQQPQVVFLQPVVSRQTSKTSSKHRRSKKYLPYLKSYPKIAPRGGSSSSSSSNNSSSSSSSSGRGTASSSGSSSGSTTSDRSAKAKSHRSHGHDKSSNLAPPQSAISLQNQLSLPSAETTDDGIAEDGRTGLARSSELAALPSSPRNPDERALQPRRGDRETVEGGDDGEGGRDDDEGGDGCGDVRRKRFCNTYNILSRSGLLDITLRTKELLRQNKRAQSDIERLKEQTEQFLEALRSGDAGICLTLQASLRHDERERSAIKVE
ncbi:CLOCK-interacting pacemaker [Eucyclogobius newberryi]|uniref:CLOCK-interacting pacemaker n=1 Tax=Eucyclogobius newberryi TaxID=166745 RepID=UPI003B5C8160